MILDGGPLARRYAVTVIDAVWVGDAPLPTHETKSRSLSSQTVHSHSATKPNHLLLPLAI